MQDCCNNISMDVLKDLLYRIEQEMSLAANDTANLFLYRFPRKYSKAYVSKLQKYTSILKTIEKGILFDVEGCFECCYWDKIVGQIKTLIPNKDIFCEENVIVDDSGLDAWLLSNPYCVSRAKWERLAYKVCADLQMDVTITEVACGLTFDLATSAISCDTTAALSVYQMACDLDLEVTRTEKECKIDYELLVEKHPDCNISFSTYKKLIDCNMSYDIVNQILCDTSTIYFKNGLPAISTPMGEYILGGNLSFDAVIAPSSCSDSLCNVGGSCTLDGAAFIGALLNDYNLTDEQKQEILSQIKY